MADFELFWLILRYKVKFLIELRPKSPKFGPFFRLENERSSLAPSDSRTNLSKSCSPAPDLSCPSNINLMFDAEGVISS